MEEADSRPAAPVRVVATICPGGTGSFQVVVRSSSSSSAAAVISVLPLHDDQAPRHPRGAPPTRTKDHEYWLDCCYPKDDDSDSDSSCNRIFHAEVKPLVDAIFSAGTSSCVIACGAAAKTHLIMGQGQGQGQPAAGLLTMAMEQILLLSQPIGAAVSVSYYQVLQDTHVFDLLEPKDTEVLVLRDAHGRTNLKGLSKLPVKSVQEFVDLCSRGSQPSPTDGHRCFVIYVSKFDHQGKECDLAKMNFLELAGYVDLKQRTNGVGLPNCNKSTNALMDVIRSLNTNHTSIPYRHNKLTRILQDSLCTNNAVLITCLDEFSSQDVVSTLSLASRSSQRIYEQYSHLFLDTRRSSKSNLNHSGSAKNLSRSLLPSIHQPSSAVDKHNRPKFNNSAVKASGTLAADKRSKVVMHSAKKPASSLSTYTKQGAVKPALSRRKLLCPDTNLSKEDKILTAPAEVTKVEELQSLPNREIQDSLPVEELQSLSNREIQDSLPAEDSSSGMHEDNLQIKLEEVFSSDLADDIVKETPVNAIQSSPKLTDRLREISNTLKLLSTMPSSVTKLKADIIDSPEPKTPAINLKSGYVEDSHELLNARSTGVKKTLTKECLSFLNSANKEELKSLKGIGEKRANYILELRKESPELFKEVDDLKNIIGMNKREIKTLMSGMVMDL